MEQKKTKKEISRLWKAIGPGLRHGQAPTDQDIRKMLRACENYGLFAEASWRDDWDLCHNAIKQALQSAKQGDLASAGTLAAEVDRLTDICHARYK